MLACLPASGDSTISILSCTQMNTGLQKWETTQKMGSASYPTPAQLDAYAKKVANNPLTIQIFPNSVKVPQRKHIRRTVNGLDTSSSSQRHSPYPTQVSSHRGLLAVLLAPSKDIIKGLNSGRARQLHKAIMNPHNGSYAAHSTLNLPQAAHSLRCPSQPVVETALKQNMVHPQTLQLQQSLSQPIAQAMAHPQALQQKSVVLQRQQSLSQVQTSQQQRLAHPPGVQRQLSVPLPQHLQQQQSQPGISAALQQQHLQPLKPPPQASLPQQGLTQDLRHMPDGPPLMSLQHSQGLATSQTLPHAVGAAPTMANGLQQPPPGTFGPRKLPDADAPPNVTVSTSTIPLSMAAGLHQNRPGNLSSIVHQINQLCQARAGMGTTSVCEGQIANPSPISRNLLINASSRVSSLQPGLGSVPGGLMMGAADKASAQNPAAVLHSQPAMAVNAFHRDPEKVHLQQLQHHAHQQKQQQQHLQQLQQQQRSWAQHRLDHMQQPPEGAHPCKNPRLERPSDTDFPSQNLSYPHKLPAGAFTLKHTADKPQPSPPVNCTAASMPYINGHYMQPPWSRIPAAAGNTGSGPRDLPGSFQREPIASSTERTLGAKYLPRKEDLNQAKLMKNVDFLGQDFHMGSFQEQRIGMMEKMHRSAMGQIQEVNNGSGVHPHPPGYH
ncbi:protein FAM222B-like [Takifugu flavidus]|nr:protein FAM222B-like [Takifugu flavidus]